MRNSKTEFMLNGASVSNQYSDVPSIEPSVDAIQEFSVQSNSRAAEYGNRVRLQFRGEFLNFTNTASFNGRATNIQASNAGHITSAGSPRDIQLALKLLF
jgi:hypothetical protein